MRRSPGARRAATILLAICALGASSSAIAKKPGGAVDTAGARFPERVGLFVRRGPVRSDGSGDPCATYWAGALALADVFYYRTRGRALQREYADCKDYVKMYTPDARLISDAATTISADGRTHTGRRAIFSSKKFGGVPEPAKSQLLIFQHKDRFLKYRITYPLAHAARVEQEIENFFRSFPWPRN